MGMKEKAPVYDIQHRRPAAGDKPVAGPKPDPGQPGESTVAKYARLVHQTLTEKESRLLSLLTQGCSIEDLCNALSTNPDALRQNWVRLRHKILEALDRGGAPSDLKRRFLRVLFGPWFLMGVC